MRENGSRDVLVTGIGAVSTFGVGARVLFEAFREGKVGARPVRRFETADLPRSSGAEVEGSWGAWRESEFAVSAAREAVADAGISVPEPDAEVWVGILQPDAGPLARGEAVDGGAAPRAVASALGFGGYAASVATACSSASVAVALASERIAAGLSDVAIAGGTASLFRAAFAGLAQLGAMARECCRPFDAGRDGVLLGEGAGFLLLESRARALARGVARPYGRVASWGLTCDASHPIAMDRTGDGVRAAMREARAHAPAPSVVIAHGTGTRLNDRVEAEAIAAVYGEGTCVFSTKGATGHTMSASGGISAVLACRMLRERVCLGNPTLLTPDPSLPRLTLPREARANWDGGMVAIHAFGFGGQNACLFLEAVR